MTEEISVLTSIKNEIEESTALLTELRKVLHNSQPEATGKIRLQEWAKSKSTYTQFVFTQRLDQKKYLSPTIKKYHPTLEVKNIVKKLNRRDPFADNYESAKKALQLILEVMEYRDKLIKKESQLKMSAQLLLKPNISLLARIKLSAKKVDDDIYENLEKRNLSHLYNHTEL